MENKNIFKCDNEEKWDKSKFKDCDSFKIPILKYFYNYKIGLNPLVSQEQIDKDIEKIYFLKLKLENNWNYEKYGSRPMKQSLICALYMFDLTPKHSIEFSQIYSNFISYVTLIDDYIEQGLIEGKFLDDSFNPNLDHSSNEFARTLWVNFKRLYEMCDKDAVDVIIKETFNLLKTSVGFSNENERVFKFTSKMTIEEYLIWRNMEVSSFLSNEYIFVDDYGIRRYIKSIISNGGERGETISKIIQITESNMSLTNDLYSFSKEINDSSLQNSVKLLAYQSGSIQGGIDLTVQLILKELSLFDQLTEKLKSFYPNDDKINTFIERYKHYIGGVYIFHIILPRYNISNKFSKIGQQ